LAGIYFVFDVRMAPAAGVACHFALVGSRHVRALRRRRTAHRWNLPVAPRRLPSSRARQVQVCTISVFWNRIHTPRQTTSKDDSAKPAGNEVRGILGILSNSERGDIDEKKSAVCAEHDRSPIDAERGAAMDARSRRDCDGRGSNGDFGSACKSRADAVQEIQVKRRRSLDFHASAMNSCETGTHVR